MKLLFLLTALCLSACQKRSGAGGISGASPSNGTGVPGVTGVVGRSGLNTAPQGGEITDGGGGSEQILDYYIAMQGLGGDVNFALTPAQHAVNGFLSDMGNMDVVDAIEKEKQFLWLARLEITALLQNEQFTEEEHEKMETALKLVINTENASAEDKANPVATNTIAFEWHNHLWDKHGKEAWSLNNPNTHILKMSHYMWVEAAGEKARAEVCNRLFILPPYQFGDYYCYLVVDSVVATHEVFSLVQLERDHYFRYSTYGIASPGTMAHEATMSNL